MSLAKDLEVRLRGLVLRLMRRLVKRSRAVPEGIDFNRCKFLFVRNDRIGDVLVSTPIIHVLKQHYPNAVIDFLLSTKNHFVLENEPLVRKRWVYNKRIAPTLRLTRAIRRERYDFVVDLFDGTSTTSSVVCAVAGGRWTVGLAKENDFVYDITVRMLSRKDSHIVDRLARLLDAFGIDSSKEDLSLKYRTSPASGSTVDAFFRNEHLDGGFVVGINISAGSNARFWGVQNFQDLIRRIEKDQPESRILLLCKQEDRARAVSISEPFDNVTLAPETQSFDLFAAFVQRLHLLITPDTSAVHLAVAFQVPSVVLYVQSNKELGIWSPYRTESETLVTDVDDLSTISIDEVYCAVRRLLARIPWTLAEKRTKHASRA